MRTKQIKAPVKKRPIPRIKHMIHSPPGNLSALESTPIRHLARKFLLILVDISCSFSKEITKS
jgi:hypothetical protein